MDKIDWFFNEEYRKFYRNHKDKQDDITDMIDGNICRICVCEDEEELYRQYYFLNGRLQELLRLQQAKFDKQKEISRKLKSAESLEKSNETDKNKHGRE